MESWLSVVGGSGSGDGSFKIVAQPWNGRNLRKGSVVVTGTSVSENKTIAIEQGGRDAFVTIEAENGVIAVPKDGGVVEVKGRSNAKGLILKMTNAQGEYVEGNARLLFVEGSTIKGTSYMGETSGSVARPESFKISYKSLTVGWGVQITDDPGGSYEKNPQGDYEFSIALLFQTNEGSIDQGCGIEISCWDAPTTTPTATAYLRQASGRAFLKLYDNSAHTGSELSALSIGSDGGEMVVHVDSNTSWSVQ